MGLFNWLLVGHLVGDYILQTSWMQKKTKEWLPLIVHSMVYTVTVSITGIISRWFILVGNLFNFY